MWDHALHFTLLVVALGAFFVVPLLVAIPFFAVMSGVVIATSVAVNRALRLPARTGNESVMGGVGTVVEWRGGTGLVRHRGELWRAASDSTFEVKTRVRIVQAEGTMLRVRPEDAAAAPVRDRA